MTPAIASPASTAKEPAGNSSTRQPRQNACGACPGTVAAHQEHDAQREHARHPEVHRRRDSEHGQQKLAVPPRFETLGDLAGQMRPAGAHGLRLRAGAEVRQVGIDRQGEEDAAGAGHNRGGQEHPDGQDAGPGCDRNCKRGQLRRPGRRSAGRGGAASGPPRCRPAGRSAPTEAGWRPSAGQPGRCCRAASTLPPAAGPVVIAGPNDRLASPEQAEVARRAGEAAC
jgi:hypothetical protein